MTTRPPPATVVTALPTPFGAGGVDEAVFTRLIETQIARGLDGALVGAVEGEAPTLSAAEHIALVRRAATVAAGSGLMVLAAGGTNATAATVDIARRTEDAGAGRLVVRTPYYNKPSQAGLFGHFRAVAEAVAVPILIECDPDRCVVEPNAATLAALAALPRIVGVRDMRSDPRRCATGLDVCGPDFAWFTARAEGALAHWMAGGAGLITGLGAIVPDALAALRDAVRVGDVAAARTVEHRLRRIEAALGDPSDAPALKRLLALGDRGFPATCRLPLLALDAEPSKGRHG